MPMHGFAKEMPFQCVKSADDSCELQLRASEITKRFYPFDFALNLIYAAKPWGLETTMQVENLGNVPLPFAAGYHPYFLTPDRCKTTFRFGLREYWDYTALDVSGDPRHGFLEGELCLSDVHDTVFWNGDAGAEIIDAKQGYRANILCAETFDVITICTQQPNASCIEPWQARPGAAERPEECQILPPHSSGRIYLCDSFGKIPYRGKR